MVLGGPNSSRECREVPAGSLCSVTPGMGDIPGTARSCCPLRVTLSKSFLTEIGCPSTSKELPVQSPPGHGQVALGGQNLWPHQAGTAVSRALSSCTSEGLQLLTKLLCAQASNCFWLEPIYESQPKAHQCLSSRAAPLLTKPTGSLL